MSCPHSTAFGASSSTCSQCLAAPVHKISYDPETRVMLVDGTPTVRKLDDESSVRSPPNRGTHAGARRQKTCGQCGKAGHTRKKCNGQEASEPGTEAMFIEDREAS